MVNISAVIVTRGDVDLAPILDSLPFEDVVVWDNSQREDLGVYGRYAAIAECKHGLIAVQDDDCLVPWEKLVAEYRAGERLCNMPAHRWGDYPHSSLIGWGSVFPREAPAKAFQRFGDHYDMNTEWFRRDCDIVFTALAPFRRVDAGLYEFDYHAGPTRMHRQPGHYEYRALITQQSLSVTPRLSVVIPTVGRDTLQAAIDSALDADELVIVADGHAQIAPKLPHNARVTRVRGAGREDADIGYTARNHGMSLASGSHIAFMDDDDTFVPGAIDLMREANADVPVVFRMDHPQHGILWRTPELGFGNVSTQMIVVPNREGLGGWAAHAPGLPEPGGDFTFLQQTVKAMGGPVWRKEIVSRIRPHARKTVTVVTPWLNHLELKDDYMSALETGGFPDELIVVDDGSEPALDFAAVRQGQAGFCRACNSGLNNAASDVVVFLNNDIADGMPGWLRELAEAVEPGVLVGARLRNDPHSDVDGEHFPYLDGWCLAGMREDLLMLGGFDETFEEPAYYSDNDLCLRARAEGMVLREVRLGLTHKTNATTGDNYERLAEAALANYEVYADRVRALMVAA